MIDIRVLAVEVFFLKPHDQLLMLLEVPHKYLLYLVHLVDLRTPLVELVRQNVDDTVTVDVMLVVIVTDLAQVSIMLHAEVSRVLVTVEAIALGRHIDAKIWVLR